MLLDGSPSSAVTVTVELAGPSGKVQLKLFTASVSVRVPLAPHDSVISGFGSSPGSLTV